MEDRTMVRCSVPNNAAWNQAKANYRELPSKSDQVFLVHNYSGSL